MVSGTFDDAPMSRPGAADETVEHLLLDALIHLLVEKGLLTRNDALSVVQTAAEVVNGHALGIDGADQAAADSALLKRLYMSFEALPVRSGNAALDATNVHLLRAPVHGERPRFPTDEN